MPVTVSYAFQGATRPPAARALLESSDGDTPYIEQPIRMVSCDTPEKAHYAGGPALAQPKLNRARERLADGFYDELPEGLRDYLIARLGPDAAQRHIDAGNAATAAFLKLRDERLQRPNGARRRIAVMASGEIVDRYGRLLAYFAPYYASTASDPLPPRDDPRRRTFNLDMIESGWAAFFPIYPSLPRASDMNLAIAAAERAWKGRRGTWKKGGRTLLLGYEYRACVKLAQASSARAGIRAAFRRACIDLRTMRNVGPFGFSDVPPPYRLWVWSEDLAQARADLGFSEP